MELGRRFVLIVATAAAVLLRAGACGSASPPMSPRFPTAHQWSTGAGLPDDLYELLPSSAAISAGIGFEHTSVQDGLAHDTVNCILQDRMGFMWFGTDDGLSRFDGLNFVNYHHDPQDELGLAHDRIMSLHEDTQGAIWIGTYGGGLNRFDPETGAWQRFQHDSEDTQSLSSDLVRDIYQDRAGRLWIATHGGGLDALDPVTGSWQHYRPDPRNPLALQDGLIDSVYEDTRGRLWIGTNNAGLARLDRSTGQFTYYRHKPSDPSSLSTDLLLADILEDPTGKLWIATFSGLNRFDPETGQVVRHQHQGDRPDSLSHNVVNAQLLDSSGILWVGTADGLNRLDSTTGLWAQYRNDPADGESLSNNHVISIYQDRAGSLWIGTRGGGLNRYDPVLPRFQHHTHDPNNPNSLGDNNVEAILEDRDGMLWIGTSQGLNRLDRRAGQWEHFQHDPDDPGSLPSDIVGAILEDRSGTLWIGTGLGGLGQFDRATGRFSAYREAAGDAADVLARVGIRALYQDAQGTLWIGTHGSGLIGLDLPTGRLIQYRHDPADSGSLGNDWIYALLQDRQGSLWIGTRDAGLDRWDPEDGRFQHFGHDPTDPQSLGSGIVHTIHQDRLGRLWVGTETGGLNRLEREKGTFSRFGVQDGLPSEAVMGILEDENGYLWLSTGQGLSRFDPETAGFKNYDGRDGLHGNVFIGGSAYRGQQGELFFGGFHGFNVLRPDQIAENPYQPPVVLTSLTQGGRPVHGSVPVEFLSEMTLRRPQGFFEFEFAALNYPRSEENQYAYRLEGFDSDWTYLGTTHRGQYDNLPVGRYTLRLKGSNNDGLWNDEGRALLVTVRPAAWETWWFRGLVALLVLGVTATGYRLRVRGMQARSRQLEAEVVQRTAELSEMNLRLEEEMAERQRAEEALAQTAAETAITAERSRLARELHDAVTQTLFSASLIAETLPRSWERDPEKGRRLLAELRQLNRGALAEMRTLLLELRPAVLLEASLGDLLQQLAEAAMGQVGVPVVVAVDGPCRLPPEVHVAVYRVAQEALNNAVKHASASRITLELVCSQASPGASRPEVRLCASDDGRGFDPGRVPPGRLGLGIMRERAQAIGASLLISSQPGQGTQVKLVWSEAGQARERDGGADECG